MNGVRTTAIAIASTSLSNLPIWVLTGLAPPVGVALGFGEVGLGAAIATFFGVAALSALPAGTIVERVGWRRGMVASATLVALSLTGMGLAPSWPVMIGFLVVGAVGFATSQPSANVALAQSVDMRRQGTAFGLKQASLPLTTLVVGISVPLFLGPGGWRWAFGWSAALTAAFLGLVVALGRRAPGQDPRSPPAFLHLRRSRPRQRAPRRRPRPALVVLALGAGLGSAATSSIGGFLVVFGVSTGLSPGAAGQLLAIGSVVCLMSRLVTGWVADRRGRGHLKVVSLMMLGGAGGFGLLAAADRPWLVVAGTALAFGLGWSWNGLFAFAVVLNHREYPATATGVVQTAMGAGSSVGPLVFGVVVSLYTYSAAWAGVAVALACGALLIVHGRRMIARTSD